MKSKRCIANALLTVSAILVSYAFESRDVAITNESSGYRLAGTLTFPENGVAPKAVLVLATGSGQQDRDETIMGHKPFKAIAEHLSANGYAVLRMDDRGIGGSEGGSADDTTDDYISDIATGVAYVDSIWQSSPCGILGHSEGGIAAIRQAAGNPDCDFIITMGTPAFRGDSIILSQTREMLYASGVYEKWRDTYPVLRHRYDMVMSQMNVSILKAQLYADVMWQQPEISGVPAMRQAVSQQIETMVSPWYREFLRYDPADDIQHVSKPWLALNGTLDRQVTVDNLEQIAGLNPAAECVALDNLNHLMLKCGTGHVSEYDTLSGDIDSIVPDTILSWLESSIAGNPR